MKIAAILTPLAEAFTVNPKWLKLQLLNPQSEIDGEGRLGVNVQSFARRAENIFASKVDCTTGSFYCNAKTSPASPMFSTP